MRALSPKPLNRFQRRPIDASQLAPPRREMLAVRLEGAVKDDLRQQAAVSAAACVSARLAARCAWRASGLAAIALSRSPPDELSAD